MTGAGAGVGRPDQPTPPPCAPPPPPALPAFARLTADEGASAGFHAAGAPPLRRAELRARRAQVFLSNLPCSGLGFHVDPVADAADGRLVAMAIDARTRRDVVRALVLPARGAGDQDHLARKSPE